MSLASFFNKYCTEEVCWKNSYLKLKRKQAKNMKTLLLSYNVILIL